MKIVPAKIDEKAKAHYGRKQAIPQWLKDAKSLPIAQRKAAVKAQMTPAAMADRISELTELVLFLLE